MGRTARPSRCTRCWWPGPCGPASHSASSDARGGRGLRGSPCRGPVRARHGGVAADPRSRSFRGWSAGRSGGPAAARRSSAGSRRLLLPVVAHNLRVHGDLSLSTSAYGGRSLYVGANRESGGQWNRRGCGPPCRHSPGTHGGIEPICGQPGAGSRPRRTRPARSRSCRPSSLTLWDSESYAACTPCAPEFITRDVHVGWLGDPALLDAAPVLAAVGMWAGRRDRVRARRC